jgi:carbon storage regulator
MLVFTRYPQQSISIDHDIKVTILEIDGSQVKVGIEDPLEVKILREEIADERD